MSWAGGVFSRLITGGWATDKATTPIITADRHDTNDDDLATGINACVNKDGSNLGTSTFYDDSTIGTSGGKLIVKNSGITATQIATSVAGNGLTGGGGTALAVNAGTGLEISSDSVRIAAAAAGNGLTGGAGSALAVNTGDGLEISSDAVRVKLDGSTIARSSSGIKVNSIGASQIATLTGNILFSGNYGTYSDSFGITTSSSASDLCSQKFILWTGTSDLFFTASDFLSELEVGEWVVIVCNSHSINIAGNAYPKNGAGTYLTISGVSSGIIYKASATYILGVV